MQNIKQFTAALPDVRQDKVQEFRSMIAEGTVYSFGPRDRFCHLRYRMAAWKEHVESWIEQ